jgi:hypothetical protein
MRAASTYGPELVRHSNFTNLRHNLVGLTEPRLLIDFARRNARPNSFLLRLETLAPTLAADSLLSDMRKVYRYKIVSSRHIEAFEKEVNACLEQLGYELYGSPFSCDNDYAQARVKSEDVPAMGGET